MPVELPALESMTLAEKLDLLERVWESLSSDPGFETPSWHGEELKRRQEAVQRGESKFIPWEEAKEQIRREVRGN